MARCKKCETILLITTLKGAGNIKMQGHRTNITSHDELTSKGQTFDVWINNAETAIPGGLTGNQAGDTDATETLKVPNKIGEITFEAPAAGDNKPGKCPNPLPNATGNCWAVTETEHCLSRLVMGWSWEDSVPGQRYGMGISGSSWIWRSCKLPVADPPGTGDDSVEVQTDADWWVPLQVVPNSNPGDRVGVKLFREDKCGSVYFWRIHFYDANIGAAKAGIIDNYFDIYVGCECCCVKWFYAED